MGTLSNTTDHETLKADVNDPTPFPEYQRVIYERTPLEFVICQVKFLPVLRIETDQQLMAAFQDALRADYPMFRQVTGFSGAESTPPEVSKWLGAMVPAGFFGNLLAFTSEDGSWEVTLTRDSLALTTKKYSRWEEFRNRLQRLIGCLQHEYTPPYFVRLGLRYRDVIRRTSLGLKDVGWSELLNSDMAGEFHSSVSTYIQHVYRQLVLKLPREAAYVTINHGLIPTIEEPCYFFDSDFATSQRTEINDAIGILNYFNRQSGRLFRWCIANRLHEAMGPRPVQLS
jgi:uncharacterized protein (TIGR04255 family)